MSSDSSESRPADPPITCDGPQPIGWNMSRINADFFFIYIANGTFKLCMEEMAEG